ncbi:MAG: thioredoxin domain-containing protein [Silvanigrellales bacterium]|nr:thioredoxin domain-containing protein [Silvanigrellales bacterium]
MVSRHPFRFLSGEPSSALPLSAEHPADHGRAGVGVVSLLLGLGGFGVSLYALIEHLKLKNGAADLSCDVNNLVNCTKVLGSAYGSVAGIPLGAYGMSFFAIVIALAVLPKVADVSVRWISWWRLLVGFVGASVSLFLAYVSYFQLSAVCIVCTTTHAISLLNAVVVGVGFMGNRAGLNFAEPSAFLKLVSVSLALGVPPLVAGLILPTIPLGKSSASETPASGEAAPTAAGTPFPAALTAFSRSDFVGKGQDYRRGNDDAKVVMMMFSDLECPHCKTASSAIEEALSVVGEDKVLFVYRNYPLSNHCNPGVGGEGHAFACELALASRCAGQQGKFWEYKDWAFSGLDMSPGEKAKAFATEGLKAQAQRLGLDAARFAECYDAKIELPKIQDDISVGSQLGLTGTPLLILNGRKYEGSMTPEGFVRAFQNELASVP